MVRSGKLSASGGQMVGDAPYVHRVTEESWTVTKQRHHVVVFLSSNDRRLAAGCVQHRLKSVQFFVRMASGQCRDAIFEVVN